MASPELLYYAQSGPQESRVRGRSMDSIYGAAYEKPESAAAEEDRIHRALGTLVEEMIEGNGIGRQIELQCSHGTYLNTRAVINEKGGSDPKEFTLDEIAANYAAFPADMRDEYEGDNFANVLLTADNLDRRMSDIRGGAHFRGEMKRWRETPGTIIDKLNACPQVEQLIWETAVVIHTGWSFGHGDYKNTWANTTPDNRLKSFTVAASMVDAMVTATDRRNVRSETVHALSRNDIISLRNRNINRIVATNITDLWDRMLNVRFDLRPRGEQEEQLRDITLQALVSAETHAGDTPPLTEKDARKRLNSRIFAVNGHATALDAAAHAVHRDWSITQLKTGRRARRYKEGETAGRRTKLPDGIVTDPRIILPHLLTKPDLNNNRSAAAIMATYITDVMIPDRGLTPDVQTFVDTVSDVILHARDHGVQDGTNRNLETLSRVMHGMWGKIAHWREGRTACIQNRRDQQRLYSDLPHTPQYDEQQYDRIAVVSSLKPMLAALLGVCERQGYDVTVKPDLQEELAEFSARIRPEKPRKPRTKKAA